jgi:ribulose-5-phosphate 4-epimerase/fuculose-1-phosphate aldolase
MARPDAHAVAHTHTTAGQAVACQRSGLLPLGFTAMFFTGKVSYHDYEGITLGLDERERLARDLGSNSVMILRNHGLLACGPTLAHCFTDLYHLQRACEVQVAAGQMAGELVLAPPAASARAAQQHQAARERGVEPKLVFDAMRRLMLEKDPSFLE